MHATQTQPRRRKAPQPVHGTCRWAGRPDADDLAEGTAVLILNGQPYWAEAIDDAGGRLIGVRLRKWGAGPEDAYDVNLADGSCTCPDATYTARPGGCKHARALGVALPRLAA